MKKCGEIQCSNCPLKNVTSITIGKIKKPIKPCNRTEPNTYVTLTQ